MVSLFDDLAKYGGGQTVKPAGADMYDDLPAPAAAQAAQVPRVPRVAAVDAEGKPEKCPKCGAEMVVRNGKNGEFFGCVKFKEKGCKGSKNIPKQIQIEPLIFAVPD